MCVHAGIAHLFIAAFQLRTTVMARALAVRGLEHFSHARPISWTRRYGLEALLPILD
jgi:hypothetical protein